MLEYRERERLMEREQLMERERLIDGLLRPLSVFPSSTSVSESLLLFDAGDLLGVV